MKSLAVNMRIGVLSDTHGLLRPEAMAALAGCEAILHGGDVNRRDILDELAKLAPVYAVRGNNDGDWAESLPTFLDFELGGLRACMTHRRKDLPADLSACDLAVCGHSHKYEEIRRGRTLLLNPGSCGPRRFHQAITLAILEAMPGDVRVTRVDIAHPAAPTPRSAASGLRAQIEAVMRESAKGRAPEEIARRHGWDAALVEQIARLYVTHPGVTADGILRRMGI